MPALPNMNIVPAIGVETFLGEVAAYIEAEFTCCHENVPAIRQAYPW
jgi:hypothetical protein